MLPTLPSRHNTHTRACHIDNINLVINAYNDKNGSGNADDNADDNDNDMLTVFRVAAFTDVLCANKTDPTSATSATSQPTSVDFERLRRLCFEGSVPEVSGYRALVWKLLLNFLPSDRHTWSSVADAKHKDYAQFVSDFWPVSAVQPLEQQLLLPEPPSAVDGCNLIPSPPDSATFASTASPSEDTLKFSCKSNSAVNLSPRDAELMESIDRDVQRTSYGLYVYNVPIFYC